MFPSHVGPKVTYLGFYLDCKMSDSDESDIPAQGQPDVFSMYQNTPV